MCCYNPSHYAPVETDEERVPLSSSYVPSSTDVVCARGRQYWNHTGNKLYRGIIADYTARYCETKNKMEKSLIVMEIINKVHEFNGRFIKKERKGGPWVEADEVFAKEKITQSLRDGLSTKYRSATKAKRQRRANHDKHLDADIERIIHTNGSIVQKISDFNQRVKALNCSQSPTSDEDMMKLFARANADILETMKKDQSLHQQFQAVAHSAKIGSELEFGTITHSFDMTLEEEDCSIEDYEESLPPSTSMPFMNMPFMMDDELFDIPGMVDCF